MCMVGMEKVVSLHGLSFNDLRVDTRVQNLPMLWVIHPYNKTSRLIVLVYRYAYLAVRTTRCNIIVILNIVAREIAANQRYVSDSI